MYMMYVDESGDAGLLNSPTRYFVLSGLVIHELRWNSVLEEMIAFRRRMKATFGLKLREEIHASAFINNPGDLVRIKRNDRLTILRMFANELARLRDFSLINVVVDKQGKSQSYDVFSMAWKALLQRFHNTIVHRNFRGPANPDERGIVFPDATDDKKLRLLMRQVRKFNPVPNQQSYNTEYRNIILSSVIEDPNFKDSANSYFVQAADLAAFLAYQNLQPSVYMRKKSGHLLLKHLEPICLKVAAPKDPLGIVRL